MRLELATGFHPSFDGENRGHLLSFLQSGKSLKFTDITRQASLLGMDPIWNYG